MSAPVVAKKLFLNARLSSYFGLPYIENIGSTTLISAAALDRAADDWEEQEQLILDEGGELELEGIGFGWWKIVN